MINNGVSLNWKTRLIGEDAKIKWSNSLDKMEDEFGTGEFQIAVAKSGDASERTASNWLKAMEDAGVIVSTSYGQWKKKLNILGSELS